jgi:hypothetical protein
MIAAPKVGRALVYEGTPPPYVSEGFCCLLSPSLKFTCSIVLVHFTCFIKTSSFFNPSQTRDTTSQTTTSTMQFTTLAILTAAFGLAAAQSSITSSVAPGTSACAAQT